MVSISKTTSYFWSKNGHSRRVSNYRQCFNELSFEGFDFTEGFKCSDVHKFEKLNNLWANILELSFYRDQNAWKHKLIPIEVSKIDSDRFINSLIYKSHDILIKKVMFF